MKLIDRSKYGPLHRFSDYHVFKTLSILSDGRRRGRKQLADKVGVGEGSMRTIVEFLREQGLIEIEQTGIEITSRGQSYLMKIPLKMETLDESEMALGKFNVAIKVKGAAPKIKIGIEQRDTAIKAGAEGATTIVVEKGRLIVPPDFDLKKERPGIANELNKLFELDEGDLLIIGTANELSLAEEGAFTAAMELI